MGDSLNLAISCTCNFELSARSVILYDILSVILKVALVASVEFASTLKRVVFDILKNIYFNSSKFYYKFTKFKIYLKIKFELNLLKQVSNYQSGKPYVSPFTH